MNQWFKSWDLMRLVRLVLGVTLVFQGIDLQQWLLVALGVLFVLMPILNIGCCGTNSCTNTFSKTNKTKETTFTEIK